MKTNWRPGMDDYPKKNILTPIGALAVGVMGICVGGAILVWPAPLAWLLVAVGVITVGVALWAYIYFAIKDPDRLQTEDYRIQRAVVENLPRIIDLAPSNVPSQGGKLISKPEDDRNG